MLPFLKYGYFKIWPWKSKVKVMTKVKPDGHIWNLVFNQYVCFSFHGNWTIFGRDIANSIFDLENSRWKSWPRSNLVVAFKALDSIDMLAFRFKAIGPFGAEIYQFPYLTLKIQSQGHGQGQIWWSYLRPRVSIDMFAFCFVAIRPFLAEI